MTAPKTNQAPSPRTPRSTPSAVTPVAAEAMPAPTESHAAAHRAPHVPAHSQASTGGEVFVSPRGIDQQAFDELSRSLREIVREAARQTATLRASVAQATRVAGDLRSAEQSQQDNLSLAAEAVKRIEIRVKQAADLVEQARSAAPALESLERQADALVERRFGAFDARLHAVLSAAEARWQALEQRAHGAARALDERVASLTTDAAAKLSPVLAQADRAREQIESLMNGQVQVQALLPAELRDPTTPPPIPGARDQVPVNAGGLNLGPLPKLLQQGETLRQEAAFATRQLDAIRQQADQARTILGESLNDMCTMIDRLGERAEDLRGQSERARAIADELAKDIALKAAAARHEIDDAVTDARAQTQGVSEELAHAATQARELVATTTLGNRVAEATVEQLRALVARLEPWQSCVQESADADTLPMPVRGLIERSREQMCRELRAVADALHAAADRAAAIEPLEATSPDPERSQGDDRARFDLTGSALEDPSKQSEAQPVVFAAEQLLQRTPAVPGAAGGGTRGEFASPLIPVTRVGVQTPVVLDR